VVATDARAGVNAVEHEPRLGAATLAPPGATYVAKVKRPVRTTNVTAWARTRRFLINISLASIGGLVTTGFLFTLPNDADQFGDSLTVRVEGQ
jgi:hypothetical protein